MKAKHILIALMAAIFALPMQAERLVILHTNDTHSQIDPTADGLGGVLRRKALIDSVRAAESNFLLIDAGDAVQGTLYFTLFRGEVEHKAMNAMGYDFAILGNHDFDNGMKELKANLKNNNATWLSTNYRFEGTGLDSIFLPYAIREFDGKRIGFIAINLNPSGMISDSKRAGVEYIDMFEAANSTAYALKHREGADMVVAISHIGYEDPNLPSDVDIAASSRDIDVIIGGHSHTQINAADPASPAHLVANLDGRPVLIAQNDKSGINVGRIEIDLDNLGASSSVIAVDSRFDNRIDPAFEAILKPYTAPVDSLMSIIIGSSTDKLDKQSITNIFADMLLDQAKRLTDRHIDFSLLNNGGIRNTLPAGEISEGNLVMVLPFDNYIRVIELTGDKVITLMSQINRRDINGLSDNVRATFNPANGENLTVTIDGKPVDPAKTYVMATLEYLADGGDYLDVLKGSPNLGQSEQVFYRDILNAILANNGPLRPDTTLRNAPAE